MKVNRVKDSEEKNFEIDYMYCNNAYMVADERCIEVPWMLQSIEDLKNKKMIVLDVGCTGSHYLNKLKTIGCEVYGNDIRMVDEDNDLKAFFVGKIQEIKAEVAFDAIICISALEHIGLSGYGSKSENIKKAQIAALKNMGSLLKDEGFICLSVPYGKKFIYRGGRRYPFFFRQFHKRPTPIIEYNDRFLREILYKSGLHVFREEYYCWKWRKWEKVSPDFLKNVKYGDFKACNATGIALLILRKTKKYQG